MSKLKSSTFGVAVLTALLATGVVSTAHADSFTILLNSPYAPVGTQPYAYDGPLYATFTDTIGGVLLTLNASGMSSSDHILAWDFNIDQSGLLGHLTFTAQGGSLTPTSVGEDPSSTLYTDDDGHYLFDFQLQFGTAFTGGKTETYLITQSGGTGTLTAYDFYQLSTTVSPYTPYDETEAFMSSADVLANVSGTGYNWLGGVSAPDGGMTVTLLGMGLLGLGSMRRFLTK